MLQRLFFFSGGDDSGAIQLLATELKLVCIEYGLIVLSCWPPNVGLKKTVRIEMPELLTKLSVLLFLKVAFFVLLNMRAQTLIKLKS